MLLVAYSALLTCSDRSHIRFSIQACVIAMADVHLVGPAAKSASRSPAKLVAKASAGHQDATHKAPLDHLRDAAKVNIADFASGALAASAPMPVHSH